MVQQNIRRIDPVSLANPAAVVVSASTLFLVFVMAVAFIGVRLIGLTEPGMGPGIGEWLVLVVIAPLCYGVFGWLGGAVAAIVYNAVAKHTGGVKVEMEPVDLSKRPPQESAA